MTILIVFESTWKLWFFSAKKDFLKQCCAQDGILLSLSRRLLLVQKIGKIGLFLTKFIHKLEDHSWCCRNLCLHKYACKKKTMLFVSQHGIFLYQLFQASHRSPFMINISLVSKMLFRHNWKIQTWTTIRKIPLKGSPDDLANTLVTF